MMLLSGPVCSNFVHVVNSLTPLTARLWLAVIGELITAVVVKVYLEDVHCALLQVGAGVSSMQLL